MKLTKRDLGKLWLPLLATLTLISIAAVLAWATHLDAKKAERERNAAAAQKKQIALKNRTSRNGQNFSCNCRRPGSPEKNAASTGWRRYAMPTTNSAFRA